MSETVIAVAVEAADAPLVLDVDHVSMRFGGLQALSDVSVRVSPGEIVGVIGPNGAGKTTLLNVMSGLLRPSQGRVVVGGRESTHSSVHKRASLGLARTFQRVTLFSDLTVREHVQLALDVSRGLWTIRSRSRTPETVELDATSFLRQVGIARLAEADVGTLPLGQARLVELAMALATRPVVLLLDEPFSGLGATERDDLADLLLELRATSGPGIVLVEHDVGIVTRLADRLAVLDFGELIADGQTQSVLQDANVRRGVLRARGGRRMMAHKEGQGSIAIRDLSYSYGALSALHGIDVSIQPGQVCCVLGPNGAGKSTFGATVAGALPVASGKVFLDDVDVGTEPLFRRARRGVAYIPEGGAVFPSLTVSENLCLGTKGLSRRGKAEIVEKAAGFFEFLAARRNTRAGMLSGGEQQMLSLARILITQPPYAIIDELSHGLAPAIVESLFHTLSESKGRTTFVLIEQYLERAYGIADILLVLSRGVAVYRGSASETSIEQLESLYQGQDHADAGQTLSANQD